MFLKMFPSKKFFLAIVKNSWIGFFEGEGGIYND